ncbi:MAG: hypothetical protein IPP52_11585 [Ignavibacteria bacterium]|nr:hypothetical protein [Ignavibacteria bacterium]
MDKNTNRYQYNGNYIVTDITDPAQLDSLNKIVKGTKVIVSSFYCTSDEFRIGLTYKYFQNLSLKFLKTMITKLQIYLLNTFKGFNDYFGSSKKPSVGIGGEYNVTNVLSPRIGLILGGNENLL